MLTRALFPIYICEGVDFFWNVKRSLCTIESRFIDHPPGFLETLRKGKGT